jgi:hypothetical protein
MKMPRLMKPEDRFDHIHLEVADCVYHTILHGEYTLQLVARMRVSGDYSESILQLLEYCAHVNFVNAGAMG